MMLRLGILVGIALAFVSLAGVAAWYRGEMFAAQAERAVLKDAVNRADEANKLTKAAFDALRAQKEREERILADISHKLAVINQQGAETFAAVAELEVNDEAVRDYLNTPIPDALKRVLDRRAKGAD